MEFRKATMEDFDLLVENRLEFVSLIARLADPEGFKRHTEEYLRAHLSDGSLHYYVCMDKGKIASSCLLCIYNTIPIPSSPTGKVGLLLNVYTKKEYRRQGLAKGLIAMMLDDARAMGLNKITLDYTDDGYPLYKSLGFKKCERDMALWL